MEAKKKIIILGTAHPLRGGLAAYNERLAMQLQQEGYEVIIYTFTLQYPNFLFPGSSQYATDPAPANLQIKVRVNSINPFNWLKVGWEIKRENADILIVKFWLPFMGPCFGTIARLAKSNKLTRIVSILDNVIPHEHRPGDKAFTKYFIGAVDGFIAMSESVQADLKTFTQKKTCLFIPHPIYDNFGEQVEKSIARKALDINATERVILFFGFIRRYKGLDLLLEAMADERVAKLNIKLLIAGEFYEDRSYYDNLIDKYQLKNALLLHTDFIPNESVKNYFGAADLVVQPYRTATQSGISQMAYHFEKPMLVTNVGGLPEIVPHGKAGFVVSPESNAIAQAIVDFYVNSLEENLINGVKAEKKKYLWEHITNGIRKLAHVN